MKEIVSGQRVADWIAERTKHPIETFNQAFGLEDDGRLVAGLAFVGWTGPDVCVEVASNRNGILDRDFLRLLAEYAFEQLGCARVSMMTEQARVARLSEWMGFRFEGVKRNGYGKGRDARMYGLLQEDWRF